MRPLDVVLRAARVVGSTGEAPATIGIRDGQIATVEPAGSDLPAARVVDLGDDVVLLPGLVDTHVHVNEPGRTEWEGFESATRAAAAGGVTTLVDMPLNSVPPTIDVPALELKRKAAREAVYVDVAFWGGAVPANLGGLRPLREAGVLGFKCFLVPSGVPEFPHLSSRELEAAAREVAALDGLLVVHAEDPEIIDAAGAPHGPRYESFLASRPRAAEDAAIAHVLDVAARTGCRIHVLHLSSGDALPAIAAARADGVRVSAETCPHYLALCAEEVPDGATQFKCCPPIRDAANRDRLWRGLAEGTIDCVVSDHSPCTLELKQLDVGDFGVAWGGIASLQVALPVVWTAARARGVTLPDVVRWMATNPADLVALRTKGRISVGAAADFCVFAPEEEVVVDAAHLEHRNPVCPYDGRRLRGVVRATWLAGREVDRAGGPRGRLLTGTAS